MNDVVDKILEWLRAKLNGELTTLKGVIAILLLSAATYIGAQIKNNCGSAGDEFFSCFLRFAKERIENTEQNSNALGIAVFFPNPEHVGSAYQDGKIQRDGFKAARETFARSANRDVATTFEVYSFDNNNDNGEISRTEDRIISKMKDLYKSSSRTRIFIVTMSSISYKVKPLFISWRESLPKIDRPVLIFTVASSPELAHSEVGVYRTYVRSEEETDVLADFAANTNLKNIGVFYITQNINKDDELYGSNSKKLFIKKFTNGNQDRKTHSFEILSNGSNADTAIAKFLDISNDPSSGALVIGYGDMLSKTLQSLVARKFVGVILSTSTLSQNEWLESINFNDIRIAYAYPRFSESPPPPAEGGVVSLFSKNTLLKALHIASEIKFNSIREFENRWLSSQCSIIPNKVDYAQVSEECLTSGDSLVHMQVLKKGGGW